MKKEVKQKPKKPKLIFNVSKLEPGESLEEHKKRVYAEHGVESDGNESSMSDKEILEVIEKSNLVKPGLLKLLRDKVLG